MAKKELRAEESSKEKIIESAFALFSQRGIKDISMREIAQISGVSKPVIYYYFKDKNALCIEVLRLKMLQQQRKMASFVSASLGLGDFLERLFAGYADNATNKKMVSFMMQFHSYAIGRREILQKINTMKEEQSDVIKDFLDKEARKGALPRRYLEVAKHLIFAVVVHLVVNSHEKRLDFSPSFAQDMSEAILRAVKYSKRPYK